MIRRVGYSVKLLKTGDVYLIINFQHFKYQWVTRVLTFNYRNLTP